MKKKLSTRELTLIVILAILIIGICYYKLYLSPLQDQLRNYDSMIQAEQTEVDTNLIIAADVSRMESAVEEKKSDGESHAIPFYDNKQALMVELNTILSKTSDFSLDFGEIEEDDYLVLRPVTLSFQTTTYAKARGIIDELNASDNLMQIGDMTIRQGEGLVQVNLDITYFEVQA